MFFLYIRHEQVLKIIHIICITCLDLKRLNTMAMKAVNSGMIIVGGGVVKHHICNANLMVSRRKLFTVEYYVIIFYSREMVLTMLFL